jgi:hypothetical protein
VKKYLSSHRFIDRILNGARDFLFDFLSLVFCRLRRPLLRGRPTIRRCVERRDHEDTILRLCRRLGLVAFVDAFHSQLVNGDGRAPIGEQAPIDCVCGSCGGERRYYSRPLADFQRDFGEPGGCSASLPPKQFDGVEMYKFHLS